MIYKMPETSQELWKQLEQAVLDMKSTDANIFIADLIKFCIDWQFAYMSLQQHQAESMASSPQDNKLHSLK